MPRITYIPTLLSITARLCKLIVKARPVIYRLYGDDTAFIAAYEAAAAACGVFLAALEPKRETGV